MTANSSSSQLLHLHAVRLLLLFTCCCCCSCVGLQTGPLRRLAVSRTQHHHEAGVVDGPAECFYESRSAIPLVRAYHPNLVPLSGCGVISEVHVVTVDNRTRHAAATQDDVVRTSPSTTQFLPITLYIRQADSNFSDHVNGGILTFVLVSRQPVAWNVVSELRGNSFILQFWVSKGSLVRGDHVNEVAALKSSRRISFLTNWIERTLGPVTSHQRLPEDQFIATTLIAAVPYVVDVNSLCPVTYQPVRGCVLNEVSSNRGQVHIVELFQADRKNSNGSTSSAEHAAPSSVQVQLVVQPISLRTQRRDVTLVLRSHYLTAWVIQTRHLRGTLDVVTDNTLDITQINMHSVRVISERLSGLSGPDLVDWTTDKYGTPVSYTFVPLANRLQLIVDVQDNQVTTDFVAPAELSRDVGTTADTPATTSTTAAQTSATIDVTTTWSSTVADKIDDDRIRDGSSASPRLLVSGNARQLTSGVCGLRTSATTAASTYQTGVNMFVVIGVAFTAFLIGCALVAVLWFIHTHTVSRRSRLKTKQNCCCDDVQNGIKLTSLDGVPRTTSAVQGQQRSSDAV